MKSKLKSFNQITKQELKSNYNCLKFERLTFYLKSNLMKLTKLIFDIR